MRRYLGTLFGLTLAGLLVLGCETREAGEEGAAEEPVAAGAEDVEASIIAQNDRFEQATLAGDDAALSDLYAEDAVLLPPNMPRSEGRAAIGTTFGEMMTVTPITSLSLETDHVDVAESGELAYEVGTYSIAGTGPDAAEWQDTGKYLVVWKNVDGEWKLAADAWSSDQPPMGAEGAAAPTETGTTPPPDAGAGETP